MDRDAADGEIQRLLAGGDPSAIDMIWAHHASDLLGYLCSLHGSLQEAEDSLQDVFVQIARKRGEVAAARQFQAYLYRMARNLAFNRMKKLKRVRAGEQNYADHWLVQVDGYDQQVPQTAVLEKALARLPENQRVVLVMKVYRGKSMREIGEMLGISEHTAGSRYRYGLEKLRNWIRKETET